MVVAGREDRERRRGRNNLVNAHSSLEDGVCFMVETAEAMIGTAEQV